MFENKSQFKIDITTVVTYTPSICSQKPNYNYAYIPYNAAG